MTTTETIHADLGGHPGHTDSLIPGVNHVSAKYWMSEHRVRVTLHGQAPFAAQLEISLSPGQWRQVIWAVRQACPLVAQP